MSSFISAAPVASGQVQSLDSLRGHSLPSDAMIVASATQVNPTNQNPGSYAIVESSGTATSVVYGGSIPATTSSPFADLYKEGSMYFSGVSTSNISATTGTYGPGTGGFTAEAWVNFQTFTGASTGYNNGGTVFQQAPSLMGSYQPSTGGSNGWSFGPTIYGQICFYYIGSSGPQTANTTTAISLNTWNHIAVSIPNGGPISLYINGVQTTSQGNNGGVLGATGSTVALVGTPYSYSPFGAGSYYGQAITAYVADIRVVSGAVVYTGSSFTVPSAPLSPYTSGTTQILIRAGQNSPTVQNGALTFDRGLKQYMNFGPQTFNIVTQGFTAIVRFQFTGTVAAYERIIELGNYLVNGSIIIGRYDVNQTVYWSVYPSNSTTAAFNQYLTTTFVQGTTYVLTFRYNPVTGIADSWVNGAPNQSTSVSSATLVADRIIATTYLGREGTDGRKTLSGSANVFAIYNRALSNVEIYNAFLALNTVPATPLQKTLEIGDINGVPALSVAGNGQVSVQSIGLSSNVVPWPPSALQGYDTVINGGVYKARASTEYAAGFEAWRAFDKSWVTNSAWAGVTGYYTSAPYACAGTITTTDLNGTSYLGDWVQIQFPSPVLLSSYTIYPINNSGYQTQVPSKFVILGSRDGVNWTLVNSQSGIAWTYGVGQTFSASVTQSFNYYRLVSIQLSGVITPQVTEIAEIIYYGTADTSPSLTIAPATTFVTSVTTPSLTGIAASGVYVPQDFSSSGLNIPAYVVSNTATVANTVAFSSFGPFAGEGSFQFPGGTATGIVFPPSVTQVNPFAGGIPDFTFECWIYQTVATGTTNTGSGIIVNRGTLTGAQDWVITTFNLSGTNVLLFNMFQTGGGNTAAFGPTIPLNQWVHVAVTLRSGAGTAFVNGVAGTPTGSIGSMRYTSTSSTIIGNGPQPFNGYIAGMRMINGQALYVGNFTPPTQSLQPIQGTTQAGLPYGTVLLLRNAPAPGRIQTTRLTGSNSVGPSGSAAVLPFPPAAMTGYSTALNAGYGQGTYVASASSENTAGGGYYSYRAFDKGASTIPYSSTGSLYAASGAYTGTVRSVDVNGTSYSGEWLQIQMPSSVVLSSYSLQQRQDGYGNGNGEPTSWTILGSNDGTNWSVVEQRTFTAWAGSATFFTFTVASQRSFSFYRFVGSTVGSSAGTNNLCFAEWTLNGTLEAINITSDGRVGLGVVNPTRALEVAGDVVCAGTLSAGNPLMFRNRIINGDMRIAQRGTTSFTGVGGTAAYCLDRFQTYETGTGTGSRTINQVTDVPLGSGLFYSANVVYTSTVTGVSETWLRQIIEAYNCFDLVKSPVTISFWYKSNRVGSHGVRLFASQGTMTDTYQTFTVFNANTWEYKALTFSNSVGASLAGATPQNAGWVLDIGPVVVAMASATVSNGDYFTLTGVQLEKGLVATPFEVRPYATELALCQRYFQKYGGTTAYERFGMGYWITSSQAYVIKPFITTMRAAPTLVQTGSMRTYSNNLGYTAVTSVTIDQATTQGTNLVVNIAGTAFIAWPAPLEASADATATLQLNAEL